MRGEGSSPSAGLGLGAEEVGDQFRAAADAEFVEDGFEVILHGVGGDV